MLNDDVLFDLLPFLEPEQVRVLSTACKQLRRLYMPTVYHKVTLCTLRGKSRCKLFRNIEHAIVPNVRVLVLRLHNDCAGNRDMCRVLRSIISFGQLASISLHGYTPIELDGRHALLGLLGMDSIQTLSVTNAKHLPNSICHRRPALEELMIHSCTFGRSLGRLGVRFRHFYPEKASYRLVPRSGLDHRGVAWAEHANVQLDGFTSTLALTRFLSGSSEALSWLCINFEAATPHEFAPLINISVAELPRLQTLKLSFTPQYPFRPFPCIDKFLGRGVTQSLSNIEIKFLFSTVSVVPNANLPIGQPFTDFVCFPPPFDLPSALQRRHHPHLIKAEVDVVVNTTVRLPHDTKTIYEGFVERMLPCMFQGTYTGVYPTFSVMIL